MHNGFVNVDSEKMSKSLGNFFTIREVGVAVLSICLAICWDTGLVFMCTLSW